MQASCTIVVPVPPSSPRPSTLSIPSTRLGPTGKVSLLPPRVRTESMRLTLLEPCRCYWLRHQGAHPAAYRCSDPRREDQGFHLRSVLRPSSFPVFADQFAFTGPPGQVAALAGKKDGFKQGALSGVLKELGYTEDQVRVRQLHTKQYISYPRISSGLQVLDSIYPAYIQRISNVPLQSDKCS